MPGDSPQSADPTDVGPLVSVIVPTRNNARTIRECLATIRGQDYPNLELVVVDNGSDDGTLEIAQEYADIAVTGGPERSAQRNQGVGLSNGEYLMYIDSDMFLDPDVVSSAMTKVRETGAVGVYLREISIGDGFWTACRALERLCYLGEPMIEAPRLIERGFLTGHGGFHRDVAGQEDAELRMRLINAGVPLAYSDGEIKHLEGRLTYWGIVRKRLYYGASIPSYEAAQPGAVKAQGQATARALARNWRLLIADPFHAAGIVVMRVSEAFAYTAGARRGRAARAAADQVPEIPACEACGHPMGLEPVGPGSVLFRCPSCRHVMRDLELAPSRARGHAWGGVGAFDAFRLRLTERRLRALVPRKGKRTVLELGFGQGALLRRFIEAGDTAAGVDRDLLEREVDPLVMAEGELYAAPAETVDLPPDRFDLVFGIHVIEHFDDPNLVFSTTFKAVKPGGVAFFMTPNADSLGLSLFRESWWNLEDPTHVRFFSPASLELMLRNAGFTDVEVRESRWDSMAMEGSSLARFLYRKRLPEGILSSRFGQIMALGVMPASAVARMIDVRVGPTIEVVARKPERSA
ncbi:MAG TPA: bifunctional glycosyltransferase/class I SAM-dependent methyltransferase [Acidimicrobiales bacterium]